MRSPSLVAGALLLTVPMLTLGVPGRTAAAVRKPTITSLTLSPRLLKANGDTLTVIVRVSPNGSTIPTGGVTAKTNLSSSSVTLTNASGVYSAKIPVGANVAKKLRTVVVTVQVSSNSGVVSRSASVKQSGGGSGTSGGDQNPPPPPPI